MTYRLNFIFSFVISSTWINSIKYVVLAVCFSRKCYNGSMDRYYYSVWLWRHPNKVTAVVGYVTEKYWFAYVCVILYRKAFEWWYLQRSCPEHSFLIDKCFTKFYKDTSLVTYYSFGSYNLLIICSIQKYILKKK